MIGMIDKEDVLGMIPSEDFKEGMGLLDIFRVPQKLQNLTLEELEAGVEKLSEVDLEFAHVLFTKVVHDDENALQEIQEGGKYDRRESLTLILYFGQLSQIFIEEQNNKWRSLKQGAISNEFLRAVSKTRGAAKNTETDGMTGITETRVENITIAIEEYAKTGGIGPSTHRLFDYMIMNWTETRHRPGGWDINLSLKQYWEELELSPSGTARQQAENDLTLLTFPIIRKWKNEDGSEGSTRINFFEIATLDRGRILANLTEIAKDYYRRYSSMPLHPDTWKFNIRTNPNAPYLFRRIQQHKHMNRNKSNENRIRVSTLINAAPLLASYDEVSKGGRQVRQRIIDPFERDMNALQRVGVRWQYTDPENKDQPLSKDQVEGLSYLEWEALIIDLNWEYYPTRPKPDTDQEEPEKLTDGSSKTGKKKKARGETKKAD
jgi:hypothetical protein